MEPIKSYRDLRVYKSSIGFLDRIYEIAYRIPHLKLRTQIINSTEAIPPLIAEGFAKRRNPIEAARFYEMAMAESDETCAHLEKSMILSKRFKRISYQDCESLLKEYTSLSKQLNRLSNVQRRFKSKQGF